MSTNDKPKGHRESFTDCAGRELAFDFFIERLAAAAGFVLRAEEVDGGRWPRRFESYDPVSEHLAAGALRSKIRRALATRYLREKDGEIELTHDVLRGVVGAGGIAADGHLLTYERLAQQLAMYEGREIEIRLVQPE